MNQVKAIRELLGTTQATLADGVGCTQGNIGHIEQRSQTLRPELAKQIIDFATARGLPLTMGQVYGLEPLPPKSITPSTPATQEAAHG